MKNLLVDDEVFSRMKLCKFMENLDECGMVEKRTVMITLLVGGG